MLTSMLLKSRDILMSFVVISVVKTQDRTMVLEPRKRKAATACSEGLEPAARIQLQTRRAVRSCRLPPRTGTMLRDTQS